MIIAQDIHFSQGDKRPMELSVTFGPGFAYKDRLQFIEQGVNDDAQGPVFGPGPGSCLRVLWLSWLGLDLCRTGWMGAGVYDWLLAPGLGAWNSLGDRDDGCVVRNLARTEPDRRCDFRFPGPSLD